MSNQDDEEYLVFNRAACYGDGVFETIRYQYKKIPLWGYHYDRLCDGLKRLHINCPEEKQLFGEVKTLIDSHDIGVIKIIVYRDGVANGYAAVTKKYKYHILTSPLKSSRKQDKGLLLEMADLTLASQPMLAGIKHLNRLEQVMAQQELQMKSADDLILRQRKGYIIETVASNIVICTNNKLVTPILDECGVYGVGLRWLQDCFELHSDDISDVDIKKADAVFLINSVRGPRWVDEIKKIKYYGKPDWLYCQIKQQWEKFFYV